MSKKLTPKQRKFCEEYVTTGNGSEAYRRAYDVRPNTSLDTIKVNSSKLLADTNILLTIKSYKNNKLRSLKLPGLMLLKAT
jgi:phage terminase small subunit